MAYYRFVLRRWYWNQPAGIRRVIGALPSVIFAIVFGVVLGWLAAQGV